jgi:hypothetical protein
MSWRVNSLEVLVDKSTRTSSGLTLQDILIHTPDQKQCCGNKGFQQSLRCFQRVSNE